METKSLYTILGVRPDASSDQIETTYAELLHLLKDGTEANPGGDDRVRLIAAKEAYTVLSNPVARQRYNQKLFAPQVSDVSPVIIMEPDNSWGMAKLLVIGSIVVTAIWVYNQNSLEKERLFIAHEKQLAENQIKLQQDSQQLQETSLQAQLQRQQKLEKEAQDRSLRESMLRDSRELDSRLQQQAREEEQKQQREVREKQYQQQQEEARRRQQQYEAERQIEKEKQALQRLQNENRRSSTRYY
jgi:curved DNA-binding protein CbpA